MGNKIGKLHTIPCNATGHWIPVVVCLIPSLRVTDFVSVPVPKKLLLMAVFDATLPSSSLMPSLRPTVN